jgi:large subunit ribosomal protein L1
MLPHGTGRSMRGRRVRRGRQGARGRGGGADVVGSADLAAKIEGGFLDFDVAIATPDQMGNVGKLGRVLGPRGLMPNPKTGTVTFDIAKAVRTRRPASSSTAPTGARTCTSRSGRRASASAQLLENYAAVVEEIARAKPAAAKGRYIKGITLTHDDGARAPRRPDAHARRRGDESARTGPEAATV